MHTLIHTPTPNLSKSLDFYQKLGFRTLSAEMPVVVTDGRAVIEINPDRYARAGLRLYGKDWSPVVTKINEYTLVLETSEGHALSMPSGTRVYLAQGEPQVSFTPDETSSGVLGKYAGLSLETPDMAKSLEMWKILGFDNVMGAVEQGWLSATNGDGVTVSLMKHNTCPHLFFNPSLTYFNGGNNLPVIAKIRELGIPIAEEITYFNKEGIVDNVIIRDPGGYGFFVFND